MPNATLTAGLLAALLTATGASVIAPVPWLPFALAEGAIAERLAPVRGMARDATCDLWPAICEALRHDSPMPAWFDRPHRERPAAARGGAVAHAIWVAPPTRERHLEF